jgi:hypothetical protein
MHTMRVDQPGHQLDIMQEIINNNNNFDDGFVVESSIAVSPQLYPQRHTKIHRTMGVPISNMERERAVMAQQKLMAICDTEVPVEQKLGPTMGCSKSCSHTVVKQETNQICSYRNGL